MSARTPWLRHARRRHAHADQSDRCAKETGQQARESAGLIGGDSAGRNARRTKVEALPDVSVGQAFLARTSDEPGLSRTNQS
jgi:hypothetical protein